MSFQGSYIGIWGAGVVGVSALHFFKKNSARIALYDDQPLSDTIKTLCSLQQIDIYAHGEQELFLQRCDYILPSAGINLKPHHQYQHKFLNELDIFYERYTKPIIGVTGTIGKTTVTHLIHEMLEFYGLRAQIGGNIGIGLFDLLEHQEAYDYAVLELSSFQLEHAQKFTPHIAIWTNFFANHLDRHETLEEYFFAKYAILKNQNHTHHALLHESIKHYIHTAQSVPVLRAHVHYFSSHVPPTVKALIASYKTHTDHYIILYRLARLLKLDTTRLVQFFDKLETPEHRVQYIGSYQGTDFYDDSKSTVVQATQGALTRFTDNPVILFFGGLSKGVSRKDFFATLPKNIKHIYFFGAEAAQLRTYSSLCQVSTSEHATLEDAFAQCISRIQPGDIVLFSPGGASFDLFKDYKQRGKKFQELVAKLH